MLAMAAGRMTQGNAIEAPSDITPETRQQLTLSVMSFQRAGSPTSSDGRGA